MLINKNLILTTFVLTMSLTFLCSTTCAQDPTPTPSPTPTVEEQRLLDEIALLKLQKEKSDLEKGMRDNLPKPSITPFSGSVELKDSEKPNMEVTLRSYAAMKRVTDSIACDIRRFKATDGAFTVVFYKPEDYGAWRNFNLVSPTLKSQISGMKKEYVVWLTAGNNVDFRTSAQQLANTDIEKNVQIQVTPVAGGGGAAAIGAFTSVATTALAGLTDTVKSFAELMSLFKSDVSFTNSSINLNPEALKSDLARSFQFTQTSIPSCNNQSTITVYDPANFSPAANAGGAFSSPILTDIDELVKLQRAASIKIALYDIVETDLKLKPELEQKVEAAKATKKVKDAEVATLTENLAVAAADKKPEIKLSLAKAKAEQQNLAASQLNATNTLAQFNQKLSGYDSQLTVENRVRISRLRALNTEVSTFISTFTQSTNNGVSLLSQYVKAENLDTALKTNQVFWIRINAVSGGGNTRVQKNLFRYFYKPDVSHSGGAIIEYSLSDRNGSVIVANTDAIYLKYRKASQIQTY